MRGLLTVAVPVLALAGAAHAGPIIYSTSLSGANESPANASAGTGSALVTYNNVAHTLRVQVIFSGLTGTTTASHIHCCTATPFTGTAGVATQVPTFAGFPLGVTSGTYDNTFDLTLSSSWNPSFITAHGGLTSTAETDFAAGLAGGNDYLNIHTTAFPGGEIRGFLVATPEPSTAILLLVPAAAFWLKRRTRRA